MNTQNGARIVPGRTCGTCMMCCKVPYIKEFDKPPGVWCAHAVAGKGCGIYDSRPASCRSFYCLWMQDPSFGPDWKPERAKFVVYLQHNAPNLWVGVDPGFPNAWTRPPYYERLKRWARDQAEHGGFVFVRIGRRVIAILPDRDDDIGCVGLDDEVVVSRRFTPAGFVYDVQVRRQQAVVDLMGSS